MAEFYALAIFIFAAFGVGQGIGFWLMIQEHKAIKRRTRAINELTTLLKGNNAIAKKNESAD